MKTVNEKRYKHGPEKRLENDSWKILWDVTITTVHIAEVVMVIIDKTKMIAKLLILHDPLTAELKTGRKIR